MNIKDKFRSKKRVTKGRCRWESIFANIHLKRTRQLGTLQSRTESNRYEVGKSLELTIEVLEYKVYWENFQNLNNYEEDLKQKGEG